LKLFCSLFNPDVGVPMFTGGQLFRGLMRFLEPDLRSRERPGASKLYFMDSSMVTAAALVRASPILKSFILVLVGAFSNRFLTSHIVCRRVWSRRRMALYPW
jgi:hypothetical protein